MNTFATLLTLASSIATSLALVGTAAAAAPGSHAERRHAGAVESFRQGRFPEAYGRFVDLANAGHAPSASYALWMCEHGLPLFGKDWDCAPHEIEDWARAAGVAPPRIHPPYESMARSPRPQRR